MPDHVFSGGRRHWSSICSLESLIHRQNEGYVDETWPGLYLGDVGIRPYYPVAVEGRWKCVSSGLADEAIIQTHITEALFSMLRSLNTPMGGSRVEG